MSLIETLIKLKVPISRLCSYSKQTHFAHSVHIRQTLEKKHFSRADKIILSHFSITCTD